MSWTPVLEFLDRFRTDRIMEQLHTWNVGEMHSNPWLLGGLAAAALITYLIGWRTFTAILVGVGGFIVALSLTVSKGTGTEGLAGEGLYIIIGGGAVAVMLFIYLLFIKTE